VSSQWDLLWRLAVALGLSSAIGLEREMRQKSAGLRTHSLVGLGAALFVLVSTYGFSDVLDQDHVVLDPSRVAAQIVSGIGFIGGGLIFVRRDSVRGLTTAAGVWVTAAVGILRDALALCTAAGFAVADLAVHHLGDRDDAVAVQLELRGPGSLTGLASELGALDGVLAVGGDDLTGAPD
jgi:putative Mg2+ transporter-C (MgtC) family protein